MPQAIPAIGSGVKFHRNHPAGEFDAIVIGYERPQDHDVDKDGLPLLTLIYLDPTKVSALGGAGWREAFVAVYSVPHENVTAEGMGYYVPELEQFKSYLHTASRTMLKQADLIDELKAKFAATTEGTDAVLQAVADEGAAVVLPSASDLDAVSEEEKAKEATATRRPRIVKGSKAQ